MAKSPFKGEVVLYQDPVLLPDMAGKEADLKQLVQKKLEDRDMDGFRVNEKVLRIGFKKRKYVVADRGVGHAYLYVSPLGKDLYVSWLTTFLGKFSFLKIIFFPITIILWVLLAMFSRGNVPGLIDFFRKPIDEFQLDDLAMLATAFNVWTRDALDTLVDQAGIDDLTRARVMPDRRMRFTKAFKKT